MGRSQGRLGKATDFPASFVVSVCLYQGRRRVCRLTTVRSTFRTNATSPCISSQRCQGQQTLQPTRHLAHDPGLLSLLLLSGQIVSPPRSARFHCTTIPLPLSSTQPALGQRRTRITRLTTLPCLAQVAPSRQMCYTLPRPQLAAVQPLVGYRAETVPTREATIPANEAAIPTGPKWFPPAKQRFPPAKQQFPPGGNGFHQGSNDSHQRSSDFHQVEIAVAAGKSIATRFGNLA